LALIAALMIHGCGLRDRFRAEYGWQDRPEMDRFDFDLFDPAD
jgi:hypothetical protein